MEYTYGCVIPPRERKCCWVNKYNCCDYSEDPNRKCEKRETGCCKLRVGLKTDKYVYGKTGINNIEKKE